MSDREDDQKIRINSSAIFFGDFAADAVGLFFASTAGLLAVLGVQMSLGIGFWIALALATACWAWQYTRLRQQNIPRPVYGEIFRQNVWIGFIVLAGMIAGSL
jgi:4-hydroxybenzoate polyprenyltransferase